MASDLDDPPTSTARWKTVAQNAIVTVARAQDPKVEAL
jgi:hypothetical protein